MSRLFNRRCSLVLVPPAPGSLRGGSPATGIVVSDLRTQFKVVKTHSKEPNTAEVQVYNLAPATRAKLQSRGTRVILSAGYQGNLSQVCAGDSRTIDHLHPGADWITKIQLGDGERNYRFATVSASYAPGTPLSRVASDLIDAMQLDPGSSKQVFASFAQQYTSGFAAAGKASSEFDALCAALGLEWSIQDGRMQVVPVGGTTGDPVASIGPTSGLVESPEHGTPTALGGPGVLKVKALLQPDIRPCRKVQVSSLYNPPGVYRVEKVTHSGDTAGKEWYTELECRAL